MDVPHHGGVGKILADQERQLMIVLHRHDTNRGLLFRLFVSERGVPL
jgi:hypothetical protein